MKIIRKNALGEIVEETDVSNIDVKDTLIIEEKKVFIEKLDITKKPLVIEIPETGELEEKIKGINNETADIIKGLLVELKNMYEYIIKLKSEMKTITLYDFIYEKKKVLVPEEYPFEYPKLIPIDTPVAKVREVDTPVDKPVYNTKIVDMPILNPKPVDTCIINHICPHCGQKSIGFMEDKPKDKPKNKPKDKK